MFTTIQNSFAAGELSPSVFSRTDLQKYKSGASTMRNFFVNYRGGAASRAGLAYVGMCKQAAPNAGGTSTKNPPRLLPFQFNLNQGYVLEFGDQYMRIQSNGAYVTETPKTVTAITKANPGVFTVAAHGFSNGDWVYGSNIGGMTEFNGLIWIIQNETTNTFTVTDLFGAAVNTTSYPTFTSGGTFARIYTVISPYAAIDLPYLKYTQSADTMSLTCVNQITDIEYPPYDLERFGATNWTFTVATFASSIRAPTGAMATAQSSTTTSTYYSYVVTAVAADGEESIASNLAAVENNDISIYAGSNTITWSPVTGATSYNIYAATPSYNVSVPIGVLYGFIGTSLATNFVDTNIIPDFTTVPPVHTNPFARGAIIGGTPTAGGSGYSQGSVGYTINTSTGSGAVIVPVVSNGAVVSYVILNGGSGYAPTDTITITGGTGATATLVFGSETGTYPGDVAYFQQRRVYASTLNNPDTYYMSQPGAFLNMDSSIPVTDSDAIVGAPWAQQINGIQFMVPMPGGLVIFTGNGAWQLNGGSSAAITPSDQDAIPQAYGGCSSIIPPMPINYDIIYVDSKESYVYELEYNYYVQIYLRTDKTVLSNHLFDNHKIIQWSYAEQPYKLVWCIRDDGVLLSLTYLKEQDVYAWAHHDTNGLFVSVCSIVEPPLDATYTVVQRFINSIPVYYSERMDNRTWQNSEQCFCVDAGLSYPMSYPAATLYPASATGTNNISSVNLIYGGRNYTAPVISAIDPTGVGNGATFTTTVVNGVITAINPDIQGQNYAQGTQLVITDSTGTNAVASPLITNNINFISSVGVFNSGQIGDIIRVGGGKATITSYVSATEVVANITQNITNILPNNPNNMPVPAVQGTWTISIPTTMVSGLNHLNGMTVAILADGSVVANQTVTNNSIALPQPSSQITIGLPYTCQLQTLYLEPPSQQDTSQGKRKDIQGVTVRMESSRGMSVGSNQTDASTQQNGATVAWNNLFDFKERNATIAAGSAVPLFTGDEYIPIAGDWVDYGQIAIEQTNPLPANVLGCIAWFSMGDTSG